MQSTTAKSPEYRQGEWESITAFYLDHLEGKSPEYIQGVIDGIQYRFCTKTK